jgi:hypothetical protein
MERGDEALRCSDVITGVITRLDRATQYSRGVGVLDHPVKPGDDD